MCRPASVINTCFHSDKIRRRDFWPQFHKTEGFPRLATTQEDVKLARFLLDFERHGEVYLASVKAVPVNAFLSTHGLETNSENSAAVTLADSRLFWQFPRQRQRGLCETAPLVHWEQKPLSFMFHYLMKLAISTFIDDIDWNSLIWVTNIILALARCISWAKAVVWTDV